ncbi:ABC-three component system middle component 1 [Maridesulfovibrio sp.]|uniref:ABC-three component system middle component 1 n=1 Tax=Maridesulfovibrio sp. TaxID=2795000 RepID=UPI0039EF595D
MINLAQSIFREGDFNVVEVGMDDSFILYSRAGSRTEYWCLVECPLDGFLERQAEIYDKCIRGCPDREIAKNASLLLVHKGVYSALCREIQTIEEDQYWFKKHVLCYTDDSLASLLDNLGNENTLGQIVSLVADRSIFSYYKDNSNSESWQSLLYRIVLKIPFVQVDSEGDGVVPCLDEIADSNVQKRKLVDVEAAANKFLSGLEQQAGSIAEMPADNVVNALLGFMEK